MKRKRKIWTGIASLALLVALASAVVGVTLAAISMVVGTGFNISYVARNVYAVVRGDYRNKDDSQTGSLGEVTFNDDSSGNESLNCDDKLTLNGEADYIEFHYQIENIGDDGFGVDFSLTLKGGDKNNFQVKYASMYSSTVGTPTFSDDDFSTSPLKNLYVKKQNGEHSVLDIVARLSIVPGSSSSMLEGKFSLVLDGLAEEIAEPVYLPDGKTLNELIVGHEIDWDSYGFEEDMTVASVTFGKKSIYKDEIAEWENAGVTPVAVDEEGLIELYRVENTEFIKIVEDATGEEIGDEEMSFYDIYILSDGEIYANSDMSMAFSGMMFAYKFNFNNFNTSLVEDMTALYGGTGYSVRFLQIFLGIDISFSLNGIEDWDVSNVNSMTGVFYNCYLPSSLDLSNWNTSNVTDMSGMFYGSYVMSINLSGWDASSVTDMSGMFADCVSLEKITFGENFDTSNVTNMSEMFEDCEALTEIDLSGWAGGFGENADLSYMFEDCKSLEKITFGENFGTSNVTNMREMFVRCKSLTELDISWIHGFGENANLICMFEGCVSLEKITFGENFDTSNVIDMSGMFSGCEALTEIDLSGWTGGFGENANLRRMFSMCEALEKITFGENFDTSNVIDMRSMFSDCQTLTELNLSSFDTSKVTNMDWMFYDCQKLTIIYVGKGWDTRNVSNSSGMFNNCPAAGTYGTSELDKGKLTLKSAA